eukprot:CAMPEP_0198732538 /NCGR_PEP_ID=MMETSP1475-20131203/36518_1 /TAXON_ID= ORGANISM="Unidentified sp., Strain CCMP1999" /NCGR_SAMPLE_ID=MMETSP1475 /ASSEMBLY_ACC=CAM_ASM_001111 /LENGTH=313 /DNA_ID=CAMNT_0044495675 /DNA_START=106 /DNA_END=1047 /DNA_ORIENTATION=-
MLRTGGLARGSAPRAAESAASKEAKEIAQLRAEVKEKGRAVGELKEKVMAMRDAVSSDSSTAKAFEAFRTGPRAFEKETLRSIEVNIQRGRIADAKSSLYADGEPTSSDVLSSLTYSASESTASLPRDRSSASSTEKVNGVEVADVEEYEVEEELTDGEAEEAAIQEDAVAPESTVSRPTEDKKIRVKAEDKGDVSNILSKFKSLERQSVEQEKLARSEERRRQENRLSQKQAAEERERLMKVRQLEEMRRQKEKTLLVKAQGAEKDFAKKWPHGEPHKPQMIIQYLKDLLVDLDKQKAKYELEILRLETQLV